MKCCGILRASIGHMMNACARAVQKGGELGTH